MKLILSLFLISSIAFASEEKVTVPTKEEACKIFSEVKQKIDATKDGNIKVLLVAGASMLAVIKLGSSVYAYSIKDDEKFYKKYLKAALDSGWTNGAKDIIAARDHVRAKDIREMKSLKKLMQKMAGAGMLVMAAFVAVNQASLVAGLKSLADDVATPLTDGTQTAYYAKNPDEFLELDEVTACAHLGADKESQGAVVLRQITAELKNMLTKQESSETAINNSDINVSEKSDLPSGNKAKENNKTSKAE